MSVQSNTPGCTPDGNILSDSGSWSGEIQIGRAIGFIIQPKPLVFVAKGSAWLREPTADEVHTILRPVLLSS